MKSDEVGFYVGMAGYLFMALFFIVAIAWATSSILKWAAKTKPIISLILLVTFASTMAAITIVCNSFYNKDVSMGYKFSENIDSSLLIFVLVADVILIPNWLIAFTTGLNASAKDMRK